MLLSELCVMLLCGFFQKCAVTTASSVMNTVILLCPVILILFFLFRFCLLSLLKVGFVANVACLIGMKLVLLPIVLAQILAGIGINWFLSVLLY